MLASESSGASPKVMSRNTIVGILCIVAALAAFGGAAIEPAPGPGAWLTRLAGDWTVQLPHQLVIGNDPQRRDTFTVNRISPVQLPTGGAGGLSQAEVRHVLRYAVDDRNILLQTMDGYAWYGLRSGPVWHHGTDLPEDVTALLAALQRPRPSRRNDFILLGSVLAAVGGVLVSRRWKSYRGASRNP